MLCCPSSSLDGLRVGRSARRRRRGVRGVFIHVPVHGGALGGAKQSKVKQQVLPPAYGSYDMDI